MTDEFLGGAIFLIGAISSLVRDQKRFVVDCQPAFAMACIVSIIAWTLGIGLWADVLPSYLQRFVAHNLEGRRGVMAVLVIGFGMPLSALILSYRIEVSDRRLAISRWFGIRKIVYDVADIVSVECRENRRELGKRRWFLIVNVTGGRREAVSPPARNTVRLLHWLRLHGIPVREHARPRR